MTARPGTGGLRGSVRTEATKRALDLLNLGADLVAKRRSGGFDCPACNQRVYLAPQIAMTGVRRWARCPRCGALERHRLQAWVFDNIVAPRLAARAQVRTLHIAPEGFLADRLRGRSTSYVSADYDMAGVDMHLDLRRVPAPDGVFDLVYASHVLEHIDDDRRAVAEIRRVLAPGGTAVLPVPLCGPLTVEYPEPNPFEAHHVRAPGLDWFQRLEDAFDTVEVIRSGDVPSDIQPFVFERRDHWPTPTMPHRVASPGRFHLDAVPVCTVNAGT